MNHILKYAVFTVIFCFLLSCSAFAVELSASVRTVDPATSQVAVSGRAKDAHGRITVIAVEKGADISSFQADEILAFDYAEIQEQGDFEIVVGFAYASGEYDFHILYDEEELVVPYTFISLADAAELIRQIADGTIKNEDLLSKIQEKNNGLGVDFAQFENDFRKNVLVYRLDESREKLTGSNDTEWAVSFRNLVQFAAEEANFLEKLNQITYSGEYYQLLYENTQFTEIDFTKYAELSKSQQTKVMESFLGKTFTNSGDVKQHFEQAVKTAASSANMGGNISAGGGGGGISHSSSSGGRTFDFSDTPSDVEEQEKIIFSDMEDAPWAKAAVERLCKRNIVSGVGGDKFEPNTFVTREQFAKMLTLALEFYQEDAVCTFADALDGWYTSYVGSAQQAGLVKGIGDNLFGIGQYISREDMTVMIYQGMRKKGIEFSVQQLDFTDADAISNYALEAVGALAGAKMVQGMGDGNFAPQFNTTRAEAAVLIDAMIERCMP